MQITVRGKKQTFPSFDINGGTAIVKGGFVTIAQVFDDYWLELRQRPDPVSVLAECRTLARKPDLFTFAQRVPDVEVRHDFYMERDNIAVLPLSSYDHWLAKQVTSATRRNIKAATNRGVVVRVAEFDEAYVRGIMSIYNETPFRQGRRFWHYGKDFETVQRENGTYRERSSYLAAYLGEEMIGYLKVVWDERTAAIMQVLSKVAHYDKRPNNALIAEAVKLSCARGVAHLQYEHFVYANKTNSSLTEFKRSNGFLRMDVPRYYVPLTAKGALALKLGLHRDPIDRLPSWIRTRWPELRAKWYRFRYSTAIADRRVSVHSRSSTEIVVPGICGFVVKSEYQHSAQHACHVATLDTMAAAMRYEPFYSSQTFHSPELGVYVSWVGRPDGASGALHTEGQSKITLATAGEPRCDPWMSRDRQPSGHLQSETLRIIACYDRSPDQIPAAVRGICSGLLVDERRERSYLFNDRVGLERLFVYENAAMYVFSSEAKAILAVVPEARAFDPYALAQFFTAGCTFDESSLFRGIRVLQGGTLVTFERGRAPVLRRYFRPDDWEKSDPLPEKAFLEEFSSTLEIVLADAVKEGSGAAISLTGGLDSRMVMACLKAPVGTVPCYTFGSMYRETYDVKVARKVARICGQPHQVLTLDAGFLHGISEQFTKAVFISDGSLGLSGAAELYLNALARNVAPIRVTGNYGGELLRGFRAFKSFMPAGDFLKPGLAGLAQEAVRQFRRMADVPPLSFTLFRQAPSGFGRYAIERSQLGVRSPFLDDRLVRTLYRRPASANGGPEPSAWLIGRRHPKLLSLSTDRGFLGGGGPIGRAAVRLFREGLFKAEYWSGHGAPPWAAAVTNRVPGFLLERAFMGRHKFVHPRPWLRANLGEFTRDVLSSRDVGDLESHIDVTKVRLMLRQDEDGHTNHSDELDKVVTLALASQLFFRPNGRQS